MTNWFADSYASNSGRTNGDVKTIFETIQSIGQETLGGSAECTVLQGTLASDTLTPVNDCMTYQLTPQTGTADNLGTIATTNTRSGHFLLVHNADAANTITLKHGTGNIFLDGGLDLALNDTKMYVGFMRLGSNFYEVFRTNMVICQQFVGGKEETQVTISNGVLPVTQAMHRVEGEGAASDNLDGASITWLGNLLILRCANASHVITIRHNQSPASGYKFITQDGNSIVLDAITKYAIFQRDTSNTCWREVKFGTSSGGSSFTVYAKSGSYSASDGGNSFYRNSSTGTITLPASPADGSVRKFKQTSGTGTFALNGAETINRANGTTETNGTMTQTSIDGVLELIAVTGGYDEA